MRSVNKVILVGHLAADPEAVPTRSGQPRVTFPLATHREFTSDGVKKDVTDYHRVVAWGKLADTCVRYLTKGTGLYIEGQLLNRAYEVGGERRYVTEVRADVVNILTWRKRDGAASVGLASPAPEEAPAS